MDSFNSDSFKYTPFNFSDFSTDSSDIDAFNLGGYIDFTAFGIAGQETNLDQLLDPSKLDLDDVNHNGFPDITECNLSVPTMGWLSDSAPDLNTTKYQPDPSLDPAFEFKLRESLQAEIQALDTVTETPQFTFTAASTSVPEPSTKRKKPVKKSTTKKSRAQKPPPDPPSRVTKPSTRKPKTSKAKIALSSPTTHPFTLYQEHRLQASVLQFLGSPSLQEQFQAQFGTNPKRLQQFINNPEEQRRLVQGMVNRELTNPAFQRMLLQSSYGYQK
jgi:hypothetical protein